MNLVERVKKILISPSKEWETIKEEEHSIAQLYTSYAIVLAAIPAISQFFGYTIVGVSGFGIHIRWSVVNALGHSIVSYLLSLVGVYIVALIINALAPTFSSQKDMTNAFKLSLYSMTPVWIAGILYIIPALSVLVLIAGIYGIYILYLGLPILMNTPKDKAFVYVLVIIVASVAVYFVIGILASVFFIPTMGRF